MYMDPARWARFKWYARFIKKLDIVSLRLDCDHKELICALIAYNGGETVFPSLQTLSWPPSSYSDFSYFPLFTARLRSANINFNRPLFADTRPPDQVPESHAFLAQLLATSPRLDRLTVCTSLQALGARHSGVIASFEYLRILHITARISLTSFRELATLQHMESLNVFYVSLDDRHPLSRPPAPIHAPRLESLRVGGNLLSLTQLFSALNAPTLASASVRVMWDDPPRTTERDYIDYVSCIEAFATIASTLLTDLEIKLDDDDGPRMCEYLLELLGPLLVAFPNVASFHLSCPTVRLVAVDDHFWAITGAWPKLVQFKLSQAFWEPCMDTDDADDAESVGIPIPTPQVLECFREDCPALRVLQLPHLDVHADVPGLFTHVPKGRPCHELRRLWFGAEDVYEGMEDRVLDLLKLRYHEHDKVGEWARYIRHLFPNLNTEECLRYCRWESATASWMAVLGRVRELGSSDSESRESSPSGGAVATSSRP